MTYSPPSPEMSSMITTTAWVRRGVAAQFPTKYEIDEEEMGRISKLARMQLEDAKEDLDAAKAGKMDDGEDTVMDVDNDGVASGPGPDGMDKDSGKQTSKEGANSTEV